MTKGEISPNSILATEGYEEFMKKHVDENFFLEWDELHCDGARVLGSMGQTSHRNYGNLKNPGLKSFINWVIERAQGTKPTMSTTLPKGDEEKYDSRIYNIFRNR